MKMRLFALASLCALVAGLSAAEPATPDQKTLADYTERLKGATEQLVQARKNVADEKAPVLKAMHEAEERILAAESDMARLDIGKEETQNRKRQLQKEHDALLRNLNYAATLVHDASVAVSEGLAPGEEQVYGERFSKVLQQFDDAQKFSRDKATGDALNLLVERVDVLCGGYSFKGQAILAENNEVLEGTFAVAGPDSFFRTQDQKRQGITRAREGSVYPVLYTLDSWTPSAAEAYFEKKDGGTVMADVTGGKALRLKEAKGTLMEHINRGGIVSYTILLAGFCSLLLILNKVYDLRKLEVDEPEQIEAVLTRLQQVPAEARAGLLRPLGSVSRELFATGITYMDRPKQVLEEHLAAALIRMRLHYERRLPLLSVIAVASPLMGLLGTVTGMVRTFALITVFGTGNAGKLASGISEVLVCTELGLIVAIPTLVAHGFLANRIHKKLSLLERYALEFSTAATETVTESDKKPELVS